MHVLFISDNFTPESNAASVRAYSHAKEWVKMGHQVTVLTCFPNFPEGKLIKGYKQKLWQKETISGIEIIRVPSLIFANRGFLLRTLDFVSFMFSAIIASLFISRKDVVLASSPQFFAAIAGWFAAKIHRRPFVLEIRDLWPDSIVAVGAMKQGVLLKILSAIERFLYRQADLIIAVTKSIKEDIINKGISDKKIEVIYNGVNLEEFTKAYEKAEPPALDFLDRPIVSYIGTLGMAQDTDLLIKIACQMKQNMPEAVLMIVGSGANYPAVVQAKQALKLDNVHLCGRVSHEEIISYWKVSDVTLVLLKDTPLFYGAIPSKIFEAMATQTPIVTNVKGEAFVILSANDAAEIVKNNTPENFLITISNVFENSNRYKKLVQSGHKVVNEFDRSKMAKMMMKKMCMKVL